MRITIDPAELRLGQRLRARFDAAEPLIKQAIVEGAFAVHAHAIDAMSEQKSGAMYDTEFRTGAGGRVFPVGERVPHRASAPGEAPAVDTGRLKTSLHVSVSSGGHAEADVVAPVSYALHLEYGTRKMAPRPFLAPALEANREMIFEKVRRAVVGER
jgi:hypothetical protein